MKILPCLALAAATLGCAATTSTSIEGNATKVSICSACKITVVGVGTVEASGSDVVVIKNGELSKN